jgi:putative DNA primase/helicase
MRDTRKAAAACLERGWSVVPLRPGEKNPGRSNWSATRLTPEEVAGAFTLDHNLGVLLGEPSGGLVDADMEIMPVVLAAPWFMPDTGAIFGRPSKPDSHRLYKIEGRVRRVLYRDPIDNLLLMEVRGEGHQTMLPPSLHPSGELVGWSSGSEPASVDLEAFMRSCGRTAAAGFFARHWPEWASSHHFIVLHLAGGLLRGGWSLEEVETFVLGVCTAAGDHEPADRLAAVRSTAKALEEGSEVTGWPSLSEYIPEAALVVLREWLQVRGRLSRIPTTDEGNAQRIVAYFGDQIRYCPEHGGWYVWDGRHWAKDSSEKILNITRETISRIWDDEIPAEPDPDHKTKLAKWAQASQMVNRMTAAPRLARTLPAVVVPARALDADPLLFNVENGTVNIQTGGLQPHNREDLITNLANVRYNPGAEAPLWRAFLERIIPDEEQRAYLQRACGYSLTGNIGEQVFFMLHGSGQNGKSTFLNVLIDLFGTYHKAADISSFVQTGQERVRSDIARLAGARLVTSTEPEEGQRLASSIIKRITGGDPIVSRFLYGSEFEHVARYKLWIATNHKLKLRGGDDAIWRRIRFLPFEVRIPDSEKRPNLDRLLLERERSGVLNWLIEGAQLWLRDGLGEPKIILEANRRYRDESDSVNLFLGQVCTPDPEAQVASSRLYSSYTGWCHENGERPVSAANFKERMQVAGYEQVRTSRGQVWRGLDLLEPLLDVLDPGTLPAPSPVNPFSVANR